MGEENNPNPGLKAFDLSAEDMSGDIISVDGDVLERDSYYVNDKYKGKPEHEKPGFLPK